MFVWREAASFMQAGGELEPEVKALVCPTKARLEEGAGGKQGVERSGNSRATVRQSRVCCLDGKSSTKCLFWQADVVPAKAR